MQLIIVRHALPERIHPADAEEADRPGGPADPPLTELGERQAERLVGALAAEDVAGLLPEYVDVPGFTARVHAAFEGIIAAHVGRETAVVVAHAGVVNTWLAHLLGLARPLTFPLDYAGITRVLATRDGRRLVRSVNEIAHVADLVTMTAGTA